MADPISRPAGSLPFCCSFASTGDIPPFYRCRLWTTVMMAKAGAELGPHSVHYLTRFAFVSPPRSLEIPGAAFLQHCLEHMVIEWGEGTDWPNRPISNFHPQLWATQHTVPNECTHFSCIASHRISSCMKGENKLAREKYLCLLLSPLLFHLILNQLGSPAGIRALKRWQPQGAFNIWESNSLFSCQLARSLSHTMGHKKEQSGFRIAVFF